MASKHGAALTHCPERVYAECYAITTRLGGRGIGWNDRQRLANLPWVVDNSRYLINNCFSLAIDGSQKIAFSLLWDEHLLQRKNTRETDTDTEQELDYQYCV